MLGVSRQTASRWQARWRDAGAEGLKAVSRAGPRSRLTDEDAQRIGRALGQGPQAYGFSDEHWTCQQVTWLIARLTGVSFHPAHVCRLIRRHGWSVHPPFVSPG